MPSKRGGQKSWNTSVPSDFGVGNVYTETTLGVSENASFCKRSASISLLSIFLLHMHDLKVQVNDVLSRQYLSRALVEVFVNYTRTDTALTGQDGGVLLHVPYRSGLPITLVASKDGYMCTLLPCTTDRMPIFSSVTMSLNGLNQGNIWLYEDSVLITGRTSDVLSQPAVRFPKNLLNLTHSSNFTSVKAFLTVSKLKSGQDGFGSTFGIVSSKSGYVSVEVVPVAAVSVNLFSGDAELEVSGPIQIILGVPDSCGLQTSHVIPAWFFNRTTGGWMRKGLGTVTSVDGKLSWTFTAPHLGYWMAASLSPSRVSTSNKKSKRMLPAPRKDQTTSTCDDDVFEVSASDRRDAQAHSFTEKGDNQQTCSLISEHRNNVISNPGAVAIALECNDLELNDLSSSAASPSDSLFFYNQPLAILHAPAFFHLEDQAELVQWSKSATLPRVGASTGEPPSKDGFTQTLSKGQDGPSEAEEAEDRPGTSDGSQEAASAATTPRGPFGLPESMSVPGTLNKMGDGRRSAHALGRLGTIPSPQPPRAWFVSLEGKPAAEIHYAVSEQQRRRRPVESRETSLDSGVDMSELSQASGRRPVTLERNATFVKSTSACNCMCENQVKCHLWGHFLGPHEGKQCFLGHVAVTEKK
uniref:Family with sequence similarity 171 member B n=1 Tax=Salarias fasciatus TaxID=181472 RepID=A0A672IBH1_SALFA